LGERCNRTAEVVSSTLTSSTKHLNSATYVPARALRWFFLRQLSSES